MNFKFKKSQKSDKRNPTLLFLTTLICTSQSIDAAPQTTVLPDIVVTGQSKTSYEDELESYLKSGSYSYLNDTKIQLKGCYLICLMIDIIIK